MRKKELAEKLAEQGFAKEIVRAFEKIDRCDYVPGEYDKLTYDDIALPIGYGQTISQPSTIAFMLSLLEFVKEKHKPVVKKHLKILEVGSGSGYVLALLSEIAKRGEIFGTERIEELCEASKERLKGRAKVRVVCTPAGIGLPERAPFDRILVSASAEALPAELLGQLADEGILVCPVKNSILKISKHGGLASQEEFPGFVFVPLIG